MAKNKGIPLGNRRAEVKAALDLLDDETKPKKRGRKKKYHEPMKTLNIDIPESVYTAFQDHTSEEGKSMTFVIIEFMKSYVKKD